MNTVPPTGTPRDALDQFIDALRAPARPHELAGAEDIVARMTAAISDTPAVASSLQESARMKSRLPRFAALTAAGVLSLGGVAAAATGTNPLRPVFGGGDATVEFPPASTTTAPVPTSTTSTTTTIVVTSSASDLSATLPEGTVPLPPGVPQDLCDTATNHGEAVSTVAKDRSTTGAEHGAAVSAVAKSDCGKNDVADDTTGSETETEAADVDQDVDVDAQGTTKLSPKTTNPGKGQGKGQGNQGQGKGNNK
jgi:hypothetical protein